MILSIDKRQVIVIKRIFCLCICLCMVLCLFGCRQNPVGTASVQSSPDEQSQSVTDDTFTLLCCHGDSFNPYLAKTSSNRQIAFLLYDALVKTDNNFEPTYVLAESVDIDKNICTVKLRDANFTDGTPVTADDVIYSYNLAKENAQYMHNFYEVTAVTAVNSKTLTFELSQHDPYFANLLNFPILKLNTSGLTDVDGKEIFPTGSGRYVLSEDKLTLKQNKNYFGKKGVLATIHLINSPDAASTSHYVEIGATDAYYTEDENIVRMSGKKTDVSLNRFVYIGINSNYELATQKEIRYAISSALDREAICRTAYYNKANCATGFFNPNFEATRAVQTIGEKPNSKITVENLSKIGYNNMNSDGFYANSDGKIPVFTLLVNSENVSRVIAAQLISEHCKDAGIKIDVVECTFEQYTERLVNGDFQLYLGEVQVLNNMDFTQLVTPEGSAGYGIAIKQPDTEGEESTDGSVTAGDNTTATDSAVTNDGSSTNGEEPLQDDVAETYCESILNLYHSGACGIADVATTLLTEMPQIPICYLNGVMFYNSAIKSGVSASTGDIYFNIENYEF